MGNHNCPLCGKGFETRRGLGVHHSHIHGKRLPNRKCALCGEEFHSDYQKKYCSEDCLNKAVSYDGENNPNYQGKKRATKCEICGDRFEYYPSEKEGRYCSACVKNETWQDPPVITGDEHPRWKGGTVTLTCPVCGEEFERYPSNVADGTNLCSNDCRAEWLSETYTGEGHPNWKGGGNEPYGTGWARIRRAALERDGYRCAVCGTSKAELGRNPDVHHIVPVRAYIESAGLTRADAHTLDNVVTLCVDCHRKADFRRIPKDALWDLVCARPPP